MNLPNKLTILRMILIIPFVIILLSGCLGVYSSLAALAIFIIASFTDMLDGQIARKYNLITNFGKFMDPLADKILVSSAFICLVELGMLPAWAVIVILAREFIISGFRLVASDNGVVIAASMWGKTKTVSQMVLVIIIMLNKFFDSGIFGTLLSILSPIALYVAVALTIISLVDYIWKNKQVLKDNKD
ncbi:MAG: CDP-diacylglycerol--glycerol-3-phosphate 3-phosphatidyltransferase [Lachnospiraceae bacterium]|nr:CDP-diacylglycerol--glycerol-3-phosphate 3-phosphatidyltransferase [Lachnospiraceae bacterium]